MRQSVQGKSQRRLTLKHAMRKMHSQENEERNQSPVTLQIKVAKSQVTMPMTDQDGKVNQRGAMVKVSCQVLIHDSFSSHLPCTKSSSTCEVH